MYHSPDAMGLAVFAQKVTVDDLFPSYGACKKKRSGNRTLRPTNSSWKSSRQAKPPNHPKSHESPIVIIIILMTRLQQDTSRGVERWEVQHVSDDGAGDRA